MTPILGRVGDMFGKEWVFTEWRMQSHWVTGAPYYRCRFPAEYALASRVQHPLNVNLREEAVIIRADKWLAREFAPHPMSETLHALGRSAPGHRASEHRGRHCGQDRRVRPEASPRTRQRPCAGSGSR